MRGVILVLLFVLLPLSAHANFELTGGGLFAGSIEKPDNDEVSSGLGAHLYTTFYKVNGKFAYGLFSMIEYVGSYPPEYLFGGAVRFGKDEFVEGGVGYVINEERNAWGFFGMVGLRVLTSGYVAIALYYRPQATREIVFGPNLGWRFSL